MKVRGGATLQQLQENHLSRYQKGSQATCTAGEVVRGGAPVVIAGPDPVFIFNLRGKIVQCITNSTSPMFTTTHMQMSRRKD